MKQYYYVDEQGRQAGPLSPEQIRQAHLAPKTLVWCEGMTGWAELSSVSELSTPIAPVPPIPPVSPSIPQIPASPTQASSIPATKPDNHFVWALLCTLLCCLPFGIVAVVQANKVDSHWNNGRKEEAIKCAESAKMWCILSFCGALLAYVFIFFMSLIANL